MGRGLVGSPMVAARGATSWGGGVGGRREGVGGPWLAVDGGAMGGGPLLLHADLEECGWPEGLRQPLAITGESARALPDASQQRDIAASPQEGQSTNPTVEAQADGRGG